MCTIKFIGNEGINEKSNKKSGSMSSGRLRISHHVEDIQLDSVNAVWASCFALKIKNTQDVVQCIYATAVSGYEWPEFTALSPAFSTGAEVGTALIPIPPKLEELHSRLLPYTQITNSSIQWKSLFCFRLFTDPQN